MSFIKRSTSAVGKLIIVITLAATFLFGMVGVVYLSLQGEEIKVPEIVGKDYVETEKELNDLGLRIKKRADRFSKEKPNTILEQLPKPGETVKTGQMILVVISKTNPEGEETPAVIKKGGTDEEDDSEKIEELISDKPKKNSKTTTSNKKKSSTTRDVLSSNSNTSSADKTDSTGNSSSGNKNSTTAPANKSSNPPPSGDTKKPPTDSTKPTTSKTPGTGDIRPRKTP